MSVAGTTAPEDPVPLTVSEKTVIVEQTPEEIKEEQQETQVTKKYAPAPVPAPLPTVAPALPIATSSTVIQPVATTTQATSTGAHVPKPSTSSGKSTNVSSVVVTELTLETKSLKNITENDKVTFTATAHFSDGSSKDVTAEATWKVLGPIGNISKGTFTAKLEPNIAEFGKGSGAVIAVWKDVNGNEVLGQTPIFEVELYIPKNLDTRG